MSDAHFTSALIPGAGQGTRLGLGPKCVLRLGARTLLEIVVATVRPLVDEVLVAAPPDDVDEIAALLQGQATVLAGGPTRQESIDTLFNACTGQTVLIQDAARPFASSGLCAAVLQGAIEHGAAGAFLDPTVPVGRLENGKVETCQTRAEARIFQAPQAYRRDVLERARDKTAGRIFQSSGEMLIAAGVPIHAVPGEPENIKITTELDWKLAQVIARHIGLDMQEAQQA